jgi:hypothetical protein
MTIIRPAVIFLVTVYVVMLAVPLLEQTIRGQAITGLRGMYIPFVIGQPLLLAAGYALGLFALRWAGSGTARHIIAALLAVVILGVVSVFSQGAGRAFVVAACLAVGLFASLNVFVQRLKTTAPV